LLRAALFSLTQIPDVIERYRDDDESANESALPECADAEKAQAVADDFDQGRTDERSERRADAAGEIGAAYDGRGDDLQLHARAQVGGSPF
jgi:hypothetical protein